MVLKCCEISNIRNEWRLWDNTKIVNSWVLGIDQRPQHHQFCCHYFVPHSFDVETIFISFPSIRRYLNENCQELLFRGFANKRFCVSWQVSNISEGCLRILGIFPDEYFGDFCLRTTVPAFLLLGLLKYRVLSIFCGLLWRSPVQGF